MVSMPQFDPTNMDSALSDEAAGALINRATQGLYPPGSTFKIVTLASALENLPDLNDFAFDCTGYYPVGNYAVTDGSAHGVQTLSDAFARSCNTTFAALSQDLGYEMLGNTAEEMGFNRNFMFSDLIVYNSSYPIDDLSAEDLAWSAIGQGRVLATPMHAHRFDDCQPRRDERTAPHRASHDRTGRKPRAAQPCGRQARTRRGRGGAAGKRDDPRGQIRHGQARRAG